MDGGSKLSICFSSGQTSCVDEDVLNAVSPYLGALVYFENGNETSDCSQEKCLCFNSSHTNHPKPLNQLMSESKVKVISTVLEIGMAGLNFWPTELPVKEVPDVLHYILSSSDLTSKICLAFDSTIAHLMAHPVRYSAIGIRPTVCLDFATEVFLVLQKMDMFRSKPGCFWGQGTPEFAWMTGSLRLFCHPSKTGTEMEQDAKTDLTSLSKTMSKTEALAAADTQSSGSEYEDLRFQELQRFEEFSRWFWGSELEVQLLAAGPLFAGQSFESKTETGLVERGGPGFSAELLTSFPSPCVVAGGAVVAACTGTAYPGTDVDIFVLRRLGTSITNPAERKDTHSGDAADGDQVTTVHGLVAHFLQHGYVLAQNGSSVVTAVRDGCTVQIIVSSASRPLDLLCSFSLDYVQACYFQSEVWLTPTAVKAWVTGSCRCTRLGEKLNVKVLAKALLKGFSVNQILLEEVKSIGLPNVLQSGTALDVFGRPVDDVQSHPIFRKTRLKCIPFTSQLSQEHVHHLLAELFGAEKPVLSCQDLGTLQPLQNFAAGYSNGQLRLERLGYNLGYTVLGGPVLCNLLVYVPFDMDPLTCHHVVKLEIWRSGLPADMFPERCPVWVQAVQKAESRIRGLRNFPEKPRSKKRRRMYDCEFVDILVYSKALWRTGLTSLWHNMFQERVDPPTNLKEGQAVLVTVTPAFVLPSGTVRWEILRAREMPIDTLPLRPVPKLYNQ